jgi:uncharacterized membrane protein
MGSINFVNTVDIGADRARVFDYLADIEHTPTWNSAISSAEKLTPGPIVVGSRFRLERTIPEPATEVLEITALRPGEHIQVAGKLGPFEARLSYDLEEAPGGTRLVNAVALDSAMPLGLLGGIVTGRIRSAVAENLQVLKSVLEGLPESR